MDFSYHPTEIEPNRVALGWKVFSHENAFELLKRAMLTKATSGSIWKYGTRDDGRPTQRMKVNFQRADIIIIDVDDGEPMQDAINRLQDTSHIIGTSKNHQKPKNGVIADRFHIAIPLQQRVDSVADFEATVGHWVKAYDGDETKINAASYFKPCTQIVSYLPIHRDLYRADIIKAKRHKPKKVKFDTNEATDQELFEQLRVKAPKAYGFLVYGELINGGRNTSIFLAAKTLTEGLRISHGRARNIIKQAPINWSGFTDAEFDHATRTDS
jgi:hypothetical protein